MGKLAVRPPPTAELTICIPLIFVVCNFDPSVMLFRDGAFQTEGGDPAMELLTAVLIDRSTGILIWTPQPLEL